MPTQASKSSPLKTDSDAVGTDGVAVRILTNEPSSSLGPTVASPAAQPLLKELNLQSSFLLGWHQMIEGNAIYLLGQAGASKSLVRWRRVPWCWLPGAVVKSQTISLMVVSRIMRTERGKSTQANYPRHRRTFKVIVAGVGGAGGNIAREIQSTGALSGLQVELQWIHIDTGLWRHRCGVAQIRVPMVTLSLARLSTGGRTDLGRAVAGNNRHLLVSLLADTDIVIVLAGMGGGSGGGVAPVVARLARDVGALTIAAVTMPFNFEGNRGQKAAASVKRLRRNTDLLFTFSNQELGAALGDNSLTTTLYEVQAQRIASSLRDLLANLRID